jgi:hypothetical protein
MEKVDDYINNLQDLEDFTKYILNKSNKDSIVKINADSFETEVFIIKINSSLINETKQRLMDIVNDNLDFLNKPKEFKVKPVKTSIVEGVRVNFY